jgi:hypothetical protein
MKNVSRFNRKKIVIGLLITVYLLVLVASRIVNIDHSARFTRDESSDLARMHEYWQDKKITLVGPISSDNIKVFGSLTYYMLMPFAVWGQFDPISPVYGTAFWGILTVLLFMYVVYLINPRWLFWAGLLALVSYPLLESSRWAWNPHLMPFWFALGAAFLLQKRWYWKMAAGLAMGMAVHVHYIAAIPGIILLLIESVRLSRKKNFKETVSLWLGYGLALMPFVVFDLRHPPGLFLNTYLKRPPHLEESAALIDYAAKLWRNISIAGFTLVRDQLLAYGLILISAVVMFFDVRNKNSRALMWLAPLIGLILMGVVLNDFEVRYALSAVVFYMFWLLWPRKKQGIKVQAVAVGYLIVTSLITIGPVFKSPELPPDIATVRALSKVMVKVYGENEINNVNITTVASDDLDMLSEKYRDYLSIKGVPFRAASEYDVSEHLFALSQGDELEVRSSSSYPLLVFGDQQLRGVYPIENSNWKVYWFSY